LKEQQQAFEEAQKQIEAFKEAEEKRAEEEAVMRKNELVKNVISREVLLGTLSEDKSETRGEELSAWDENKLTGFSEALAAMPEPQADVERSFGKGKANEGEATPETERKFAVKMVNGRIVVDKDVLRGE
jgi:hypothetical protein